MEESLAEGAKKSGSSSFSDWAGTGLSALNFGVSLISGALSAAAARESARAKMSALSSEKMWNLGVMRRNKADAYARNILESWGAGINPMTGSNLAVTLGNQAVLQDEINFREQQYDIELRNLEAQSKQKFLGLF